MNSKTKHESHLITMHHIEQHMASACKCWLARKLQMLDHIKLLLLVEPGTEIEGVGIRLGEKVLYVEE